MKRSEINFLLREAQAFFQARQFFLPPFAFWSPDEWRRKGPECREIVENQLGWDITDFGSGDFMRCGLLLFTLRNGSPESQAAGGRAYAEKIMIVNEDQVTPTHFHYRKCEDIINRGGGELVLELWNNTGSETLADTPVTVSKDGVTVVVQAGEPLVLQAGESVCLPPRLWHTFYGRPGTGHCLIGEVSRINDDRTDNRFLQTAGRFPALDEDEPPVALLCSDYAARYRPDMKNTK